MTNGSNNPCQLKYEADKRSQVEFLICRECFWCASCLNKSILVLPLLYYRCPTCEGVNNFDSIPICSNEGFRYNKDGKKGVELEFFLTSSRDEDIQRQDEEGGEVLAI